MNFGNPIFTPVSGPLGRGRVPLPFASPPNSCTPFQPEFQFSPTSQILTSPPPKAYHFPTFYSSPPPPPSPPQWVPPTHVAPPAPMTMGPVPVHMHSVPYDHIQNSGLSTNSSPLFYPPISSQAPNIEQFSCVPKYQRPEKVKDWESAFESAARRHGITLKEAPKPPLDSTSKSKTSSPAHNNTKSSANTKKNEDIYNTNYFTSSNSIQNQSKQKPVDKFSGEKDNTVSTSRNSTSHNSTSQNSTSQNSSQNKVVEKMDNVSDKNNAPSTDNCLKSKEDCNNNDDRSMFSSDSYQSDDDNSRFIYVSEGDEFESDSNETSSPPIDRRRKRGEDSSDWAVSCSSVENSPTSSPKAQSSETQPFESDRRREKEDSCGYVESSNKDESDTMSRTKDETTGTTAGEANESAEGSVCLGKEDNKEGRYKATALDTATTDTKERKEAENHKGVESNHNTGSSSEPARPSSPCEAEIQQFIQDVMDAVVQNLLREMTAKKTGSLIMEVPRTNEPVTTNGIYRAHSVPEANGTEKDGIHTGGELGTKEQSCSTDLHDKTPMKSNYFDGGADSVFSSNQNNAKYIINELNADTDDDNNCDDNDDDDDSIPDIFVKRALQKGIKVGNRMPVKSKQPVQPEPVDCGIDFERLAAKNGIRIGSPSQSEQSSPLKEKTLLKTDCYDEMFERFAAKNGIRIGSCKQQQNVPSMQHDEMFEKFAAKNGIRFGASAQQQNVPSTQHDDMFERFASKNSIRFGASAQQQNVPSTQHDEMFERFASKNGIIMGSSEQQHSVPSMREEFVYPVLPIPVPEPVRSPLFQIPCIVKAHPLPEIEQVHLDNQVMTFEQIASKHGIKVGVTKANADCQTDQQIFHNQASQTYNLIKVNHQSVQVDVDQEAFRDEFNAWMQAELNLTDPTAASFRELYHNEIEAHLEAERRLEVEMDENVKSQRATKMQIDDLKEELQNQETKIENLTKELKKTKKHKDHEIKKLTKDLKVKEEDMANLEHEIHLKDVAIENINLISTDQTTKIEQLQEKIKAMEYEMEKEWKKNSSFTVEPKKEPPTQVQTSEWQVVKSRNTKAKQGSQLNSNHIDSLSGFDDPDYETFTLKNNNSATQSNGVRSGIAQNSTDWRNQRAFNTSSSSITSFNQQSDLHGRNLVCNFSNTSPPKSHSDSKMNSSSDSSFSFSDPLSSHSSLSSLSSPRLNMSSSSADISSVDCNHPLSSSSLTNISSGLSLTKPCSTPSGFASSSVQALSMSVPTTLPPMLDSIPTMYLPSPPPIQAAPVVPSRSDIPLPTRKVKTATKQPSGSKLFDNVMEFLRDQFPNYSRPLLMVYLNQAKFSYGAAGFDGKEISEIVNRVSQIIQKEAIVPRT